jgi:signal transduction histidine kinase
MTFDVRFAGTRERLRQVGAQLEIERRERGTTVRAIAPLPRGAS